MLKKLSKNTSNSAFKWYIFMFFSYLLFCYQIILLLAEKWVTTPAYLRVWIQHCGAHLFSTVWLLCPFVISAWTISKDCVAVFFTIQFGSQPRRIYKPRGKSEGWEGVARKTLGYLISPCLLCLKTSPQLNQLISYPHVKDRSPQEKKKTTVGWITFFFVKVESNKSDFVMVPKFKQNAAALKQQVSAEFNSRNIVDLTQLIAYNPD